MARVTAMGGLAEEFDRVRRRGGVTEVDAEALGTLGIDINQVVDAVERAHGARALSGGRPPGGRFRRFGHIPFSKAAKQTLKQTLREAVELGDPHIGGEHLLLALVTGRDRVADVLGAHGLDAVEIRRQLCRAS